ncbi:hypothetical protein INR49_027068 [Caranx melampygus]|nr:hypothetical protein INR49_027068 [Caranx melampygus]
MAAGTTQGDTHMEELVDQGLGMEETGHDLLRRPSLKESYHSDSLLAPDTDFMTVDQTQMEGEPTYLRGGKRGERVCSREERKRRKTSGVLVEGPAGQQRHHDCSSSSSVSHDDRSSAASGLDVADRLTYLEQRMQMQEDEIQLLKMALADVLKRLNISEEHQAAAAAASGRRAPGAKARPVSLALPSRSPMQCKESTGECEGQSISKSKEAVVSVVTMQIYLSPHARKTGSSETATSASAVPANSRLTATPNNPQAKAGGKLETKRKPPTFTLNLQKTTTSQNTPQDTSNYKSPIKSPSQYFQICY